jgi:hypothetical protein
MGVTHYIKAQKTLLHHCITWNSIWKNPLRPHPSPKISICNLERREGYTERNSNQTLEFSTYLLNQVFAPSPNMGAPLQLQWQFERDKEAVLLPYNMQMRLHSTNTNKIISSIQKHLISILITF